MFSGVSAENIRENHLCVLCVSAVNVYLCTEEKYVYILFVALVTLGVEHASRNSNRARPSPVFKLNDCSFINMTEKWVSRFLTSISLD